MSSEETSQPDPNSTSPQLHQESKKRKLVEDIEGSESHDFKSNIPTETEAANFNRRVMKRLQKAYEKNPEVDLYRLFPVEYSGRLEQRIKDHEQKQNALAPSLIDSTPDQHVQHKSRGAIETDIRSKLDPCCPVEVVHPLSSSIRDIIDAHKKRRSFLRGCEAACGKRSDLSRPLLEPKNSIQVQPERGGKSHLGHQGLH